jgi:hypothetical protein
MQGNPPQWNFDSGLQLPTKKLALKTEGLSINVRSKERLVGATNKSTYGLASESLLPDLQKL